MSVRVRVRVCTKGGLRLYKTRGRVLSGGAADGKKDVGDKGGRRGGGEAGWDAVREGEGRGKTRTGMQ